MSKFKLGIQLYTLRDEMEKDVEKTLEAVSKMGYTCVEFAGYFGKTAEEMRMLLDRYGLEAISVHQGYNEVLEDTDATLDYMKKLGIKFYAIPGYSIEKHAGHAEYPQTVEDLKKAGKLLKEQGIQLCYHNHDQEFDLFDGKYILDHLLADVPAEYLEPEFDCGWVTYANEDPAACIRKYAGRVHIVHLKDVTYNVSKQAPTTPPMDKDGNPQNVPLDNREANGFSYRPVGQGKMDVPAILKACEEVGARYLIVEQDDWPTASAMESARQSAEYLKNLI